MSLTAKQIRHIAHLARLEVGDERLPTLGGQLDDILGMVDALRAADTGKIAPMAHPLDMAQRLRDDTVTEENRREAFQQIAPQASDGLYLVPRVIE